MNHLVKRRDSNVGRAEGSCARGRGRSIIPVGATNNDSVRTAVATTEPEVVTRKRAVGPADAAKVASNRAVEAALVARAAAQVMTEVTEAGVELLEDDSLGLNLADLFEDDPLGHLLEDEETLLDDLDGLGVADDALLLNNLLR